MLHVGVVTLDKVLRLETKISHYETILRTNSAVIRSVQMAMFKPPHALPDLLDELEKQLQGGKGGVIFEPPDWMFKRYDRLLKKGKISQHI